MIPIAQQGLGFPKLLFAELRGPAGAVSPRPRGFEAGHGALARQFPLEFREGAEDVEDQAAAGAGGVDRFGEGSEADIVLGEVLHGAYERA